MTLRKPVWLIVILALLLSACNTAPAPTPAATATPQSIGVPRFEKTDCWFKKPLGRDVECGWLIVPEDHTKPDDKTIKLAVARFKSDADKPEPDPIVYLEGGPGGSPLRNAGLQFDVVFGPLATNRDVILFDQRGTGYSVPALDCPEIAQEKIDTLNQSFDRNVALEAPSAAKCRDRLAQEGVNLAAFNSAQSAADVAALRQALGYDQINLYGISYGTRLALTTMRDFPQGIRSVVIDGIVPLQADMYAQTPRNGAQALEAVFKACEANVSCNQTYPNLSQAFSELKAKLDKDPVKLEVTLHSGEKKDVLLDGNRLVYALFMGLYQTSLVPSFPRLIYDVRDGSYDMLAGLISQIQGVYADISWGMNYSVECQEAAPFASLDALNTSISQNPEYAALADKGTLQTCQLWKVPVSPAKENEAVTSDIPTLVLSGEFDPITPPVYGKQAAETLSKSFFFQLPKAGHGASATEDCPRNMAIAFFNNPAQKPDDACLSEMAKTSFVVPMKASDFTLKPFSEAQLGISSVIPEGWKQVQAGMYSPSGKMIDSTAMLIMAAPVTPDMLLNLMQQSLSQANVKIEFEQAGTRTAHDIEWTLYQTNMDTAGVDLALGQKGNMTYLVMLQSPLNDRKALVDGVFLPAIDALQPQ
jgi:pimeloyl-ACP methyl ester carboxylesterase